MKKLQILFLIMATFTISFFQGCTYAPGPPPPPGLGGLGVFIIGWIIVLLIVVVLLVVLRRDSHNKPKDEGYIIGALNDMNNRLKIIEDELKKIKNNKKEE